jgi:hypothetical protein
MVHLPLLLACVCIGFIIRDETYCVIVICKCLFFSGSFSLFVSAVYFPWQFFIEPYTMVSHKVSAMYIFNVVLSALLIACAATSIDSLRHYKAVLTLNGQL